MLGVYRDYLYSLRNSLIREGVSLKVNNLDDYSDIYYFAEQLNDIFWLYSVLAISNSKCRLKNFIWKLDKKYYTEMRKRIREEYLEEAQLFNEISSEGFLERKKQSEVNIDYYDEEAVEVVSEPINVVADEKPTEAVKTFTEEGIKPSFVDSSSPEYVKLTKADADGWLTYEGKTEDVPEAPSPKQSNIVYDDEGWGEEEVEDSEEDLDIDWDDDDEEEEEIEFPEMSDEDDEEEEEIEFPEMSDDDDEDVEFPEMSDEDDEDEDIEFPEMDDEEDDEEDDDFPEMEDDDEDEDVDFPEMEDDDEDEDVDFPELDDEEDEDEDVDFPEMEDDEDEDEDVDFPEMEDDDEDVDFPEMEDDDDDVDFPEMSDDDEDEDVDFPEMEDDDEDVDFPEMEDDDEDVDFPEMEDDDEDEDIDFPEMEDDDDDDSPGIDDRRETSQLTSKEDHVATGVLPQTSVKKKSRSQIEEDEFAKGIEKAATGIVNLTKKLRLGKPRTRQEEIKDKRVKK